MALTQIRTRQIVDLAITTAKIAANAVTLGKLGALTTKGDVLTHDGSTHLRLPVGTDGQVLMADSGEDSGLAWGTPASAGVALEDMVFGETPAGTVDGSNATFTLAATPEAGTVRLYVNGVRQNVGGGNDYTISTDTITFETAAIPQAGDVIVADYIEA